MRFLWVIIFIVSCTTTKKESPSISEDVRLLRRIMAKEVPKMKECYKAATLKKKQRYAYNPTVKFRINTDSTMTNFNIEHKNKIPPKIAQEINSCLEKIFMSLKYPKVKGEIPVDVIQPLNFSEKK